MSSRAVRLVALRMNPLVPALLVAACLVTSACSLAASHQGLGSHEADLAAIRAALDTTISEGNLSVLDRSPGEIGPCLGTNDRTAGQSLTIDLRGESAVAVSHRVADVWRRHADEWFGGGLSIEDSTIDNPGSARVSLGKGGWGIEANVPDNKSLGQYTIGAYSPCY